MAAIKKVEAGAKLEEREAAAAAAEQALSEALKASPGASIDDKEES